jgi:hypothetical protein
VLGVPAATTVKSGGTLVPTIAGVFRLSQDLSPVELFVPPSQTGNQPSAIVHILADGTPVFFTNGGLSLLHKPQVRRFPWSVNLDAGAELNRIEDGPGGVLLFEWSAAGARHHDAIEPAEPGRRLRDARMIDVRDLPEYIWRRLPNLRPDPRMKVGLSPGRIEVTTASGGAFSVQPARPVPMLEAIRWKERLMVIGRNELLELNLGRIADQVFADRK